MTKKICVITVATSPDAYFPLWKRYYGGLFGQENLFVVTFGSGAGFEQLGLGGLWVIAGPFEDNLSAKLISKLVSSLLEIYDVVIRCDVDEFLVPDRNKHKSLISYIDNLEDDYVTAVGIDVIEGFDDGPLRFDFPILGHQRRLGVLTSALDKTSLTSVPLEWGAGFHATKNPPNFNELFIFHFKWADVNRRAAWHLSMSESVLAGTSEDRYFRALQGKEDIHIEYLRSIELETNFFDILSDSNIYNQKFIEYKERPSGLISSPFVISGAVIIPFYYGQNL